MVKISLAAFAFTALAFAAPAAAQQLSTARVLTGSCGTTAPFPAINPGQTAGLFMDNTGHLCSSATGGGGGGAVTIADGADVAQGTTTDVAWTSGPGTEIALLKTIAAGPSPVVSHLATPALASFLLVKGTPGSLSGFNCTSITGGAAGFCIAYNSATTPGNGPLTGALVLDSCWFDTTARGCSLGRAPSQVAYSAGIQILVSVAASPFAYTAGATAFVTADFK